MGGTALFMGAIGLAASFLPQEILAGAGLPADRLAVVLVQVLGAVYLGFAILNWMARGILIGGVYARPVALGNFLHFGVVAVVLLKALLAGGAATVLGAATVPYAVFGLWFGAVLLRHPSEPG
jgi:hypothetical protein